MAKGEITAIRDVAADFARPGMFTHKEVQFRIDGAGPFSVMIPMDEYSAKKAMDEVGKKVREWAEIVGKPVSS